MRNARRIAAPKIGLQMFTIRTVTNNATAPSVFQQLGEAGYRTVELAGQYGYNAAELRGLTDSAGLRVVSSHVNRNVILGDWEAALDDAKRLGQRWIVVPNLPGSVRNPDGFRQVAEEFNEAGELARRYGIQFGYHNHAFEFATLDSGETGWEILLSRTDPRLVEFQMDLYWAVAGGADPVEEFQKYPRRFTTFHVKDMNESGGITRLGTGIIDFARIFANDHIAGAREYIIEQDNAGNDPLGAIGAVVDSINWLHNLRY